MKVAFGSFCVFVATVVCASCGTDSSTASIPPDLNGANAVVVQVIDGDTVDLDFDGTTERVRLIGIDTPETKRPDTPVECFGPEASAFTESVLTEGAAVRVERDAEARDDYGRLLGYVYRASDGLFVNLQLVAEGYAQPLTIPPNVAHATEFVQAARDAHGSGKGLWSSCTG